MKHKLTGTKRECVEQAEIWASLGFIDQAKAWLDRGRIFGETRQRILADVQAAANERDENDADLHV